MEVIKQLNNERRGRQDSDELSETLAFYEHCLENLDPDMVIYAAFELGCLGSKAENSLTKLINLIYSDNQKVRASAIAAMGRINSQPEKCIPVFKMALFDNDLRVRQYAAASIGLYQTTDLVKFNVENTLRLLANDSDNCIREFVRETLERVEREVR